MRRRRIHQRFNLRIEILIIHSRVSRHDNNADFRVSISELRFLSFIEDIRETPMCFTRVSISELRFLSFIANPYGIVGRATGDVSISELRFLSFIV